MLPKLAGVVGPLTIEKPLGSGLIQRGLSISTSLKAKLSCLPFAVSFVSPLTYPF